MFDLAAMLPAEWRAVLHPALERESFRHLSGFLETEYRERDIYPPADELFTAFRLTPPDKVRVVILGQDPYHRKGQAHGLSFSVKPGVKIPASLRNIFKELHADTGAKIPENGCLIHWAEQGVLLLNTVLTVRAGCANSHAGCGWEDFTDDVIRTVDSFTRPIVFVLWGAPAQKKRDFIRNPDHFVLTSAHPSPFSAYRGFFGSRPFSRINGLLSPEIIHWDK